MTTLIEKLEAAQRRIAVLRALAALETEMSRVNANTLEALVRVENLTHAMESTS